MFGVAYPHHGYGRFRRNALDGSHDVFIEHEVTNDPDMLTRITIHGCEERADAGRMFADAHAESRHIICIYPAATDNARHTPARHLPMTCMAGCSPPRADAPCALRYSFDSLVE